MSFNFINDLAKEISLELQIGKPLVELKELLRNYNGEDWKQYTKKPNTKYVRKLAYRDSTIDIYVITWNNLQESRVHDHPEEGCLMKVLQGSLEEDIYEIRHGRAHYTETHEIENGHVGYQIGSFGLHNIKNPHNFNTVSIHIYSPPCYCPRYY